MRYNSKLGSAPANPGMLPSEAVTADMSLTGTPVQQPPIVSEPRTFNPGIKATGAPVPFSPKAQAAMTGAFGMPADGSYDRTMGTMV